MSLFEAFLLLLLYSPLLVYSETCPHPEDIVPCYCRYEGIHSEIIITCTKGTTSTRGGPLVDIERAFRHLQGKKVKEVIFRDMNLGKVSSVFFWGLYIQKLHFQNTVLESIADGLGKPAFLGLDGSLEALTIDNGFGGNAPLNSLNLGHLRHLKSLFLSFNSIGTMANDWLRASGTLADVRIFNNRINVDGDRVFQYLGNLKTFWFSGNRLKFFRRTMLPRPARNLIEINLSNNSLASIPDDMFIDMPALKTVLLQSNAIQRLPSTTWSRVWEQLELVNLSENPLECDPHIEWIIKVKRPRELDGTCAAPEHTVGLHLKDLIDTARNGTMLSN